jgi:NitT/TauT family transport system substrate-binding protein
MAALGVAIALVLPLAAGGQATADARSLEAVTIATPPFEPTALAFYADARGFFRKHGIEAKIVVLPNPGAVAAAIVAGDATFGPADIGGLMLGKSHGLPVRLVAAGATYQRLHPTAALVSAPERRFARARDLVGRRIGVDRTGSIAHVALLKWLRRGGVRADAVKLSYHAFPDMIGLLTRGKVDAAVLPEPYLTQAKQRGSRLVATVFQSVCTTDCLLTGWVARKDADRSLAARFRNAIQAAAVWANNGENDAASGAILARHTKLGPAVIRSMTRSTFATRLRLKLAQPWVDVYKEFELIPNTFTPADLIE